MSTPAGTPWSHVMLLAQASCDMIDRSGHAVSVVVERRGPGSWSMQLRNVGGLCADDVAHIFAKADELGVPWGYDSPKFGTRSIHFGQHRAAYLRSGDRIPDRKE